MSQQYEPYSGSSDPYGHGTPDYARPQPTAMSPAGERTTGMLAHGIPLAATVLSAGTLGFVASLVMWMVYKDRGPFVRAHVMNALNVQIMCGIVLLISIPLMLVLVGFVTYGLAWLVAGVLHLIGAIKAYNGEWWDPPLTPRFVR